MVPAQTERFGDLATAIGRHYRVSASTIDYTPDPAIEVQFGRQPPLLTPLAHGLGFMHDGDIGTLVARAVTDGGTA